MCSLQSELCVNIWSDKIMGGPVAAVAIDVPVPRGQGKGHMYGGPGLVLRQLV